MGGMVRLGDEHELATPPAVSFEPLFSAVIEASDDAIFACDGVGRITSWSATAIRLFGCSPGDALGHVLADLFPADLRDQVASVMARVSAGEHIQHFEAEIVRGDGMPAPVSLSWSPIFDADQFPNGSVVIVRDVTEQRLTQATLAEVELRLQEGEALAGVGSWLWDLRTSTLQWSAEFHRIHGLDPLDFEGTLEAHLAPVHTQDRDRVRAAMDASVSRGKTYDDEYRIVRVDGSARVVHVRAQPIMGSDGRAVGLRGIGQDVTDAISPAQPDA
ncbi:MAG: PAS domain-containing protein [Acidimicrobiales bacterium]